MRFTLNTWDKARFYLQGNTFQKTTIERFSSGRIITAPMATNELNKNIHSVFLVG